MSTTHVPVTSTAIVTTSSIMSPMMSTTHVPVTSTAIVTTSSISSTTTSASSNDSTKLVTFSIKVFFHDNLPALIVEPVHLVDGQLGHLLGGELHHSSTSWFPRFIIEQLDVGNLADLLPEEVLHLLPLHLIGQVGDEDSLVSRAFPRLDRTSPHRPTPASPISSW